MAVSKPQDSADQPQPPRSDEEVKRLRDAVLFAWEHLHSVVKKNGGSTPSSLEQTVNQVKVKAQENQVAPPQQQQRQMQPQTPNQKGSSKHDSTRPSSMSDRTSTKVDRVHKPSAHQAKARL